ncbi:MAG: type II toxin-antitoxin system HicB family antitoxin [Acidobacteria bacterium]|nr:type II toxin-antitoxin system HicB family antitoxin [Acidobacteriota bacterium]
MDFVYPARFRRDCDGRWVVHFPDLPEAHTDGATRTEALTEAEDCLGSTLAVRMAESEPLPRPSPMRKGTTPIPVPVWLAPKLAIHFALEDQRISNSELARRLGVRETVVRRLLDPDHASKTQKLAAALAALGKRITMRLDDAA